MAVVDYLIRAGANRGQLPIPGSRPLAEAAKEGNREVVMRLLSDEAGCPDPSIGLFYSASLGYLPGVERFLAAGANLDSICPYTGGTPLTAAAAAGQPTVVNALLGAGAGPTVAAADGTTPLLSAVKVRSEIVSMSTQCNTIAPTDNFTELNKGYETERVRNKNQNRK